jgi:RND family efflux transporter MFP subunit
MEKRPSRIMHQKIRPAKKMITILFPLFLGIIVCTGCGKGESETPEKIYPVKLLTISSGQGLAGQTFPGKVRAAKRVDLSFRVSGPLMELPAEEGQLLKKGALVARILPRDFETNLKKSKARILKAEEQYNRYKDLYARNQVSKADLDKYKSERDVARAQEKEALDALKDTYLRSPFTGVVAKRYVENFEEIRAKQPIISLQDISEVEILIDVPETIMTSNITNDISEAYAQFSSAPEKKFPLKIKEYTTEADPKTHTYQVVLVMPQPKDINVLPGMTANVIGKGKEGALKGIIRIPAIAVLGDPQGKGFVWVVDEEMIVHKRSVVMGPMTGTNSILIPEGLKVGEKIIVAGLSKLEEGVKVMIQNKNRKGVDG